MENLTARPDLASGTLFLSGELDQDDVELFNDSLRLLRAVHGETLTIDLSELAYMGSAGLGCLIRAAQTFRDVRLAGVHQAQLRLLEVTGLTDQFDVLTDAETPVAAGS